MATSNTVDTVAPGGGIPNLIGTGTVLVNGSTTTETRFGDYTSVSIDPSVSTGTCGVVANQYFAPGGAWRTRIARVGNCAPQPLVSVPDLTDDTPSQAASDLSAIGLCTADLRQRAVDKLAEIERRMADLDAIRQALTAVVAAECDSLTDCTCPNCPLPTLTIVNGATR